MVINLIELTETDTIIEKEIRGLDEKITIIKKAGVRCRGTWRITDAETGQSETFCGIGEGTNAEWRTLTMQTVMFKQALLMYYFTSWPVPTNMHEIIKEELAKLPEKQLYEAIASMLPKSVLGKMTAEQAAEAIKASF